jgi:DNA-binding response OmpR family regulator
VSAYDVCPLCEREIAPGAGVAAFRGGMAHVSCWLEQRESAAAPRRAVLVVDDDDAGRYAVRRILEHANFQVTEASDGASALTAIAKHPDLVLLDLRLPDVDGFEICRRIKSSPDTASIRVLPLTAVFTSDGDRRRAFELGADGYLVRPVAADELIATVNGLIGLS